MKEAVLVLFTSELPHRPRKWWKQFGTLIAPEECAPAAKTHGLTFESLHNFTAPGSVEEAATFLSELARTTLPDGTRISGSVTYAGYELWWLSYDELFYRQCIPYTQYRRLLEHLLDFEGVTLYKPPAFQLLRSFLSAHGARYSIIGAPKTFPAAGIWLQVLISLLSWPILIIKRPETLVYTGDLFDPPRDHSFRMRFIYDELYRRKLPFVEFIRSMEPGRTMLAHAWKRRRPVIYSYALKIVIGWCTGLFGRKVFDVGEGSSEEVFKRMLAATSLHNTRALAWSIICMNVLVRTIGIRSAIIPAASSRTMHEVLGCREAGVPSIGILHGAASRFYNVYDFMPEYVGEKRLGLDVYGMWSEWWRNYYLAYGKVYGPHELVVSGPMRPIVDVPQRTAPKGGHLKVLFIAEQLAEPTEVVPYLEELMRSSGMELFFKFRPYNDGFEEWLKKHRPDLYARMDPAHIMHGAMPECIARCHVVVGSHSTAVLEAVLQLTPMVFFHTKKWGDYFGLEPFNTTYGILAKNPRQLIQFVMQSQNAPRKTLEKLREMFFGDPHKNGSAWLVDEAQKHL